MSPLLVRCFASCLACLFFCSVLPVHPAVPVAPSCSSFISTQPMPRTPSNPSRMSLLLSPLRNTKQNFSSPTTRSPSPMKSHWRQAHHVDCVDNPVRCLAAAAKHWAWAGWLMGWLAGFFLILASFFSKKNNQWLRSKSGGGSPLIRPPNRPNSPLGACLGWFGPLLGSEQPWGGPVLSPENAATVRGSPFPEEVLSF